MIAGSGSVTACFFVKVVMGGREAAEITIKNVLIFGKKGSKAGIEDFFAVILERWGQKGAFSKLDFQIGTQSHWRRCINFCSSFPVKAIRNLTVAAAAICRKKTFSKF